MSSGQGILLSGLLEENGINGHIFGLEVYSRVRLCVS